MHESDPAFKGLAPPGGRFRRLTWRKAYQRTVDDNGFKSLDHFNTAMKMLLVIAEQDSRIVDGHFDVTAAIRETRSSVTEITKLISQAIALIATAKTEAKRTVDALGGFDAPFSVIEDAITGKTSPFNSLDLPGHYLRLMEFAYDATGEFSALQESLQSLLEIKPPLGTPGETSNVLLYKALTVCRAYLSHEAGNRKGGEQGLGWTFKSMGEAQIRASNDYERLSGQTERAVCDMLTLAKIPYTFGAIFSIEKKIRTSWPPRWGWKVQFDDSLKRSSKKSA